MEAGGRGAPLQFLCVRGCDDNEGRVVVVVMVMVCVVKKKRQEFVSGVVMSPHSSSRQFYEF